MVFGLLCKLEGLVGTESLVQSLDMEPHPAAKAAASTTSLKAGARANRFSLVSYFFELCTSPKGNRLS